MSLADWNLTYLPPIIFEFVIFLVGVPIWVVFVHKWRTKRSRVALLLAGFFGLYEVTIALTVISQTSNLVLPAPLLNPGSYLYLLLDSRVNALVFVANLVFYFFYLEIFSTEEHARWKKVGFITYTIAGVVIGLLPVEFDDLELVIGVLLLVHSLILYVPALLNARTTARKIEGPSRYAFVALFLTALFFILVWIFTILDLVWDLLTGILFGPFSYVIWACVLAAMITSYLGYMNPKWFQRLIAKDQAGSAENPSD